MPAFSWRSKTLSDGKPEVAETARERRVWREGSRAREGRALPPPTSENLLPGAVGFQVDLQDCDGGRRHSRNACSLP